jgi:cytochrome c-type biogenesis protein CcmE
MKKSSILILIVIAIAGAIIASTTGDAGQYINFGQAFSRAGGGDEDKYHVVGELFRLPDGTPGQMVYDPKVDPNYFSFKLKDSQGRYCKVEYYNPKPQDFERSEKVVVVGRAMGQVFVADKILLKCPSKYQETKI